MKNSMIKKEIIEIIKGSGPPGPQGPQGPPGADGTNGIKEHGVNGTNGVNGTDFDPCVACLLDALVKLDSGAILVNVTVNSIFLVKEK